MKVRRHAATALIAMSSRMPVSAEQILKRLIESEPPKNSAAIIACRMTMAHGYRETGGTNGDTLVIIVRHGLAITAFLRRSWNESFTPEVLRVDEVIEWQWATERRGSGMSIAADLTAVAIKP